MKSCWSSGLYLHLSPYILQDIFVSLSQVDGLYFVCNIDDFKFLADMIQHIPLNLRSRYVFCTAPINKKQPFVCTSFLKVSLKCSKNLNNAVNPVIIATGANLEMYCVITV